jgi:LysM repeat protein
VQSGDTLYSIARRFGLSTQALAAANNIADPSHIWVGQRLIIPSGGAPAPVPTSSPTPTPTPGYDFALERFENIPNCGLTQIWGYIHDAAGNGLSNYTVRVTTVDGSWSTVSNPSDASGYYDIVLAPGAKAGKWLVFVVAADGSKLSSVVDVETTTDCQPGSKGVQTPRLDFRRR